MNVQMANRVRAIVTLTATLIMAYALFVSADHITHDAHFIGLRGYQAATLFVLIDVPALVGKALQLRYFAGSTRRTGRRLMMFSGSMSFVGNVLAGFLPGGGGLGAAAYGAFVVVMFLVLENVVTKIKPAAAVTRARNAQTTDVQPTRRVNPARSAAAKRAAQTRRTNALAARQVEMEPAGVATTE